MAKSELRLIKNVLEYVPSKKVREFPPGVRGFYVLYKRRYSKANGGYHFNFVYIGMATNSVRGRLWKHAKSKAGLWTHFSVFEVWDNISDEEVGELEGLFRHLYRFDNKANALNRQKGYKKLTSLKKQTEAEWDLKGE